MEDPSVRQGMANLQVVDALSGQRDRHKQNYFIRPQKGDQPARVTGIDNDIAFGRGSHAEDPTRSAMYGYFGGLPSYVDKGVADRARALEEDDFELALGELLDKAEVGATVKRWRILCKRLDEMEEQGLLVKDLAEWGKLSTQQLAEPRSYLAGLAVPGQLNPFKDEAGNRFTYEELQQVRMLGPEEWEKQQAKQRDEARTPEEPELEELRA
ncbi:MAG: hypothetical protein JO023_26035 [Chloroflexi bacterium]|nr:hypothetical protein [Chloroflexota bacterium]